jgi:hypothetical protein
MTTSNDSMCGSQIKNRSSPLLLLGESSKSSGYVKLIENTSITTEKEEVVYYEETKFSKTS